MFKEMSVFQYCLYEKAANRKSKWEKMNHLEYQPDLKALTKRLNGCVYINPRSNFYFWKPY